jgi:predicted protein tyrosine phosphatase
MKHKIKDSRFGAMIAVSPQTHEKFKALSKKHELLLVDYMAEVAQREIQRWQEQHPTLSFLHQKRQGNSSGF